jgi:cytoskeletal protein RodZ
MKDNKTKEGTEKASMSKKNKIIIMIAAAAAIAVCLAFLGPRGCNAPAENEQDDSSVSETAEPFTDKNSDETAEKTEKAEVSADTKADAADSTADTGEKAADDQTAENSDAGSEDTAGTSENAGSETADDGCTIKHHDAVTEQVWVQDTAAGSEQVIDTEAWDESVCSERYMPYTVQYADTLEKAQEIADNSGSIPTATISLNYAGTKYSIVIYYGNLTSDELDAFQERTGIYAWTSGQSVYSIIHHDATYKTVMHDATGHYETQTVTDAYDEKVCQ